MTHLHLWLMLTEAETRAEDSSLPQDVRERSAETASLVKQRMAKEGLTRTQLREFAYA